MAVLKVLYIFAFFLAVSQVLGNETASTNPDVDKVTDKKYLHEVEVKIPASEADDWAKFRHYIHEYKKVYGSVAEVRLRFDAYKRTMKEAERLQKNDEGTAEFGETKFSDWTTEELKKYPACVQRRVIRQTIPLDE
ncbi:cathepsin propeptide inhibitor domain (I29) domain-containing protein [Ditylenchus destructor]|uniref:Cathepsin propeptide inhibitor domain (I29) domain-containing protein n=1 Tax=Ditylenchus destructor TaxID=166010 RepID=A0AAD4MT06_9BILA|nr:cathepsin propeptide inhibitor domain (I29) domain-containing protein [Ditylenchus destructor]